MFHFMSDKYSYPFLYIYFGGAIDSKLRTYYPTGCSGGLKYASPRVQNTINMINNQL